MGKKIYRSLMYITISTSILTSIVLTIIFYGIYRDLSDELTFISLFVKILPAVIIVLALVLVFIYFYSSKLTTKILKPVHLATQKIESILSGKSDEEEIKTTYEELRPFMRTIQLQKEEIEMSIDRAKESEKYRREFTANVTHELKTPLTSIIGYAEMITSGMTDKEETEKFANTILKEGTRLLDLIDQILNLSKIEGQIETKEAFEDLDIYEVAKSTVVRFKQRTSSKNIELSLDGKSTITKGNRSMIEDLFSNLIDNAIKYNKDDGKVDIVMLQSDKEIFINIKDTGMGIPREDIDRIFERFYRVDKSRSKQITGTGIGLSIVKHIVEYHDGNINLSSEVNKGTEIEIRLPKLIEW